MGKSKTIETRLKATRIAAWKAKDLRAGIGMMAAAKKAAMLQMAVKRTDVPDLRRTSPI